MFRRIVLSFLGLVVIWFFSVPLPIQILDLGFEPFVIQIYSLRYIGWIPIIAGTMAILWCYWLFIFIGKGTPWPFDPPKKLIVSGLYRYVRNPMELGFLLVLFGEVLLFESSTLIIYIAFGFFLFHMRQVFIEEPNLRKRFGKQYEQYCESVSRWVPRLEAYIEDSSVPHNHSMKQTPR